MAHLFQILVERRNVYFRRGVYSRIYGNKITRYLLLATFKSNFLFTFHDIQFYFSYRLLWTKAVYDYMYSSGETLLRNFPVQATIQVVDQYDSDSSDDDDEEDDDDIGNECSEQENVKKCKQ